MVPAVSPPGVLTLTVGRGLCVEASAVPALPLLLLLCPSASQHPKVPSRARATAQTPRPHMSVTLRDKNIDPKGVSGLVFTAHEADVFALTPKYPHKHAASQSKARGDD